MPLWLPLHWEIAGCPSVSTGRDHRAGGELLGLRLKLFFRHQRDGHTLLTCWDSLQFPNRGEATMAWKSLHKAAKSLTANLRRTTHKFAARIAPVGVNVSKRRHWTNDLCPRCNEQEHHHHFLQCTEGLRVWNMELHRFELWLLEHKTDPRIARSICGELSHWHTLGEPPPTHSPELRTAVTEQRAIGWHEALHGCWSA